MTNRQKYEQKIKEDNENKNNKLIHFYGSYELLEKLGGNNNMFLSLNETGKKWAKEECDAIEKLYVKKEDVKKGEEYKFYTYSKWIDKVSDYILDVDGEYHVFPKKNFLPKDDPTFRVSDDIKQLIIKNSEKSERDARRRGKHVERINDYIVKIDGIFEHSITPKKLLEYHKYLKSPEKIEDDKEKAKEAEENAKAEQIEAEENAKEEEEYNKRMEKWNKRLEEIKQKLKSKEQ